MSRTRCIARTTLPSDENHIHCGADFLVGGCVRRLLPPWRPRRSELNIAALYKTGGFEDPRLVLSTGVSRLRQRARHLSRTTGTGVELVHHSRAR
ncbi:hypothetical protein ACFU99_14480 [Streptomyces sp. NPDC057654]|uniref:hypothetical protein n=1 Tax=Streptomyces sp. NPDC057654 TaxID=3346196 RepID=UPI00369585C6